MTLGCQTVIALTFEIVLLSIHIDLHQEELLNHYPRILIGQAMMSWIRGVIRLMRREFSDGSAGMKMKMTIGWRSTEKLITRRMRLFWRNRVVVKRYRVFLCNGGLMCFLTSSRLKMSSRSLDWSRFWTTSLHVGGTDWVLRCLWRSLKRALMDQWHTACLGAFKCRWKEATIWWSSLCLYTPRVRFKSSTCKSVYNNWPCRLSSRTSCWHVKRWFDLQER